MASSARMQEVKACLPMQATTMGVSCWTGAGTTMTTTIVMMTITMVMMTTTMAAGTATTAEAALLLLPALQLLLVRAC